MSSWNDDLSSALAASEPEFMRAMLEQVPAEVLQTEAPALERLARQYAERGQWADALVCLDPLIRARPDCVDAHAARAGAHLALGQHAESLADAARVVALSPDDARGHCLQGETYEALDDLNRAASAYRTARRHAPDDEALATRLRAIESTLDSRRMFAQSLGPQPHAAESTPPPAVHFDPALLDDPSIPDTLGRFRVDGVVRHLQRYSAQYSPRNALARLDDSGWLAAWDRALLACAGKRVALHGSAFGVLGLRALQQGATHVACIERFALDARITTGIVQKHFLQRWHAAHGDAIDGWSEDERRESFEAFAAAIDISSGTVGDASTPFDVLAFPALDHSLLGTGIVSAIRDHRRRSGPVARVLPARARLHAMGVRWRYPGSPYDLSPVNMLRWSPFPRALDLPPEFWTAVTPASALGEIDFEDFRPARWELDLPVVDGGAVDAILWWFELDLGGVRISNAPDSDLRAIRPAVQYIDPIAVRVGEPLPLLVDISETRVHIRVQPGQRLPRSHALPDWHVPMLGDAKRNAAYLDAIGRAIAAAPVSTALDIGASCGLLAMLTAQAGANHVVGCRSHPAISAVGNAAIEANGFAGRARLLDKDWRRMTSTDDLPSPADLVVFDLFDCSLIGNGVLHFLAHARKHLLADHARFVPASACLRAQVIEYRLERALDIDINLLNAYRFAPGLIDVDATRLLYRPLTDPFDVFRFDFATAAPAAVESRFDVAAIAAGTAGAVLLWFDLQLDATTSLSNAPDADDRPHWKQGLQFLQEVHVEPGRLLPLTASHDGAVLRIGWQQGAVPRDAISSLPRFDPRWLAASNELEQQTAALLQHCASDPDEYSRVAAIAQRIAVDPAAHGIDPVIAQRFAAMLAGR